MTAETVVRLLSEKGLLLTAAESCTGGLIAERITNVSGASSVFHCGIVSYANDIKAKVLGVSEETLRKYGAVSPQTAAEMAEGVRALASADISVSVTGIAGPNSDETGKPVGLIYIALADKDRTMVKKLENHFSGDVRTQNREAAADAALTWLAEYLKSR